ncbi:MAG: DUF3429 domain-containing protein [Thiomonas sp.]|nr:DUF3429 domain-containing protein [Thiomonas sp.]
MKAPAYALGLAGLIPFIALGFAAWIAPVTSLLPIVAIQAQYAAAILAFLGALYWGAALALPEAQVQRPWLLLGWGVVLPLWAWRMTWGLSVAYSMTGLFIGLAIAYAADVMLRKQLPWPSWFLPLRLWLTLGALLGLGLTLVRLYTLNPAG